MDYHGPPLEGYAQNTYLDPLIRQGLYPLLYDSTLAPKAVSKPSSKSSPGKRVKEFQRALRGRKNMAMLSELQFLGTCIALGPRVLVTTGHHCSQQDSIGAFVIGMGSAQQQQAFSDGLERDYPKMMKSRTGTQSRSGQKRARAQSEELIADDGLATALFGSPTTTNPIAAKGLLLFARCVFLQKHPRLDIMLLWTDRCLPFFIDERRFLGLAPALGSLISTIFVPPRRLTEVALSTGRVVGFLPPIKGPDGHLLPPSACDPLAASACVAVGTALAMGTSGGIVVDVTGTIVAGMNYAVNTLRNRGVDGAGRPITISLSRTSEFITSSTMIRAFIEMGYGLRPIHPRYLNLSELEEQQVGEETRDEKGTPKGKQEVKDEP